MSDPKILTCAFCGKQYPPGTPASQHALLTAHVLKCEKHPMTAMREFVEQISYDETHGCCDGDCPHQHANDCLTDLIKLIKERAEEARKLLAP